MSSAPEMTPVAPAPLAAPSALLVVGFARTGQAVARAMRSRGASVIAVDDRPNDDIRAAARALEVELLECPEEGALRAAAANVETIVVSPGVPPTHAVFALAAPGQLCAEVELAYRLTTRPVVAITGTNGKTTVTELATQMLVSSGRRALAAGNIGLPLVEAIGDDDVEIFVVEVSSFQLQYTTSFAPSVATYLNLAEDHLDWHGSLVEYGEAKARLFAFQPASAVAIANIDDGATLAAARAGAARLVTFGARSGDYHEEEGLLVGPGGEQLATSGRLPRQMPHDRLNALAALATALEAGASPGGCREALAAWQLPPHRVELVAEVEGVRYFDDSKATTPSAVLAALAGFEEVVLIAGGRNKGLDIGAIAAAVGERGRPHLRGVIAIGEAADEVVAAFSRHHVERAVSMREAIERGAALARRGDAVLLSPGCASFDWYRSYGERGDDFAAEVRRLARRSTVGGQR